MLLWSSKLDDRTLDSFLSCYPNYIAMYIFLRGRGDGKSWGQGLVWTHLSCSMGWGRLQMFLFLINFLHALASISVPGLNIILDFSVGRSRSSQEETNCGAHRQLKSDQLSFVNWGFATAMAYSRYWFPFLQCRSSWDDSKKARLDLQGSCFIRGQAKAFWREGRWQMGIGLRRKCSTKEDATKSKL